MPGLVSCTGYTGNKECEDIKDNFKYYNQNEHPNKHMFIKIYCNFLKL